MYLQITTKCNMTCEHCCFRCTMNGRHMTRRVWRKAIGFAKDSSDSISIGGGEPTLHPDFWEIIGTCIGSFEYVWMATNGSRTEIALALAALSRKEALGCVLSQDDWHDPIDERVVEAFSGHYNEAGKFSVNNMAPFRDPDNGGNKDVCPCESIFIDPIGNIKPCGCLNAPIIGDVFKGYYIKDNEDFVLGNGECWKKNKRFYHSQGFKARRVTR